MRAKFTVKARPATTTPWYRMPATGTAPMRSKRIDSVASAPAANSGSETIICQKARRASFTRLSRRPESARRSPSRQALASTIQSPCPVAPGAVPRVSTSVTPAKATRAPRVRRGRSRSPGTRKCANTTANRGLVAISTEPFTAEVALKPKFISAICSVNSTPTASSAGHSARVGASGMRAYRAHAATQALPSAKRSRPLHSGGNASRTARAGIDQLKEAFETSAGLDYVAGPDDASGHDPAVQARAVEERLEDLLAEQVLEVLAGDVQPPAVEHALADAELAADQVV